MKPGETWPRPVRALRLCGAEKSIPYWRVPRKCPLSNLWRSATTTWTTGLAVALGHKPGHIYSRNTNPTVAALEEKVRLLEGAEAATSFASGMAAVSNTIYSLVKPGDRIVTVKDTYGGTNQLFREFLPKINVNVCLCDTADAEQIEKEIQKGCQLLYLETPTSPTLKVVDIARLAAAGNRRVRLSSPTTRSLRRLIKDRSNWVQICAAQRFKIPGRPRGCARRDYLRTEGNGSFHLSLPRDYRRRSRSFRGVPSTPRAEDARNSD